MGQETVGRPFQTGAEPDHTERLDRMQDEIARIGRMLADLTREPAPRSAGSPDRAPRPAEYVPPPPAPARDYPFAPRSFEPDPRTVQRQRAKAVRRMIRQRRLREQFFPADLFADPAWDMLLDLYAAQLERQPVSVSSLCIAAAVPATTALRWIKTMTDAGLFSREPDLNDGRRIFIDLAQSAYDGMEQYFEALEE
jgi:DNA-binding MarR family transcriptional regulator